MKRIIRLLVLFSLSFTLLSCLSVESEITVKNDGSGTLTLSYRISRMVTEIGRLEDENTLVPLPVTRGRLQANGLGKRRDYPQEL